MVGTYLVSTWFVWQLMFLHLLNHSHHTILTILQITLIIYVIDLTFISGGEGDGAGFAGKEAARTVPTVQDCISRFTHVTPDIFNKNETNSSHVSGAQTGIQDKNVILQKALKKCLCLNLFVLFVHNTKLQHICGLQKCTCTTCGSCVVLLFKIYLSIVHNISPGINCFHNMWPFKLIHSHGTLTQVFFTSSLNLSSGWCGHARIIWLTIFWFFGCTCLWWRNPSLFLTDAVVWWNSQHLIYL